MAEVLAKSIIDTPWLDTAAVAEYLWLSPASLRTFRCRGEGPPYNKIGRAVRYHRDKLDAYARAGRQGR